jgi:hypothetical protein
MIRVVSETMRISLYKQFLDHDSSQIDIESDSLGAASNDDYPSSVSGEQIKHQGSSLSITFFRQNFC